MLVVVFLICHHICLIKLLEMFKIQNFLSRTHCFLRKVRIPKNRSKYQSFTRRPSFTKLFFLLPSTCLFAVNFLSMNRLQWKTVNCLESETSGVENVDVKKLMKSIATEMTEDRFQHAITHINKGIEISERNNFTEFLPDLYDALLTMTVREGNHKLAEEIAVRSIEKLLEIGYKDSDNEIIRFQLTLARLYQYKGDSQMAAIGFRNCMNIQERKYNEADGDEPTLELYLSLLFWYSNFLSDKNELVESKNYMKKALEISKKKSQNPKQTVVILYMLAELSFITKELDDVIKYLVEGLHLCLTNFTLDRAIPSFMVKLGLVYLLKGMHRPAEHWCRVAQLFAKACNNDSVFEEASLCLKQLKQPNPRQ